MGQKGLKPMDFRVSTKGSWKVALEQNTPYGEVTITGAAGKEAAAAIDYKGASQAVAGFVVSLDRTGTDVAKLSAGIIGDIQGKLSGASSVSQLSSGNVRVSHDKFPTVVSTQLAVTLSAAKRAGAVRNALLAALLGKPVTRGGFDNSYLKTWLNLFTGKDPKWKAEGKAMVHLIGGICAGGKTSSCSAEVGHGYLDLVQATGGIAADICQKNLGPTLQIIIDTITGAASPAILQYVPISASLAVGFCLDRSTADL